MIDPLDIDTPAARWIPLAQAPRVAGRSPETVRRWVASGHLPVHHLSPTLPPVVDEHVLLDVERAMRVRHREAARRPRRRPGQTPTPT